MADFEEIYLMHFDDVYRFVFSLCRNEDLAEEITQEAFYKALKSIDKFDGKCKLYVWLCQIAKNTYFTYAKKNKKLSYDESISVSINPESEFLQKETAWEIHKSLHGLKEPYKEVFTLRVFGELSFLKIGELFGKTDSWARVIFYRAKEQIRRDLNENSL